MNERLTTQQKKNIVNLAKELFLEIIKHQPYTELEGDLNGLGKFCINAASTFYLNDWNVIADRLL